MALQWKFNSRYPSVTRPGVFPRIQDLDEQGVDLLTETWENLTGIDEEEMNKFKFSLGTWVHVSRRNRRIQVLSADKASKINFAITSVPGEPAEPIPTVPPDKVTVDSSTAYTPAYELLDFFHLKENLDLQSNSALRTKGSSGTRGNSKWRLDLHESEGGGNDIQEQRYHRDSGWIAVNEKKLVARDRPGWHKHSKVGGVSPQGYWIITKI